MTTTTALTTAGLTAAATPIGDLSFIEVQFPVSKMSNESYTERKAVAGQTLTGLGKWWGRKPLVLCRATILGLLLPATNDPQMDREVFLRLMTMDPDGLRRRADPSCSWSDSTTGMTSVQAVYENLSRVDQEQLFDVIDGKPKYKADRSKEFRELKREAFYRAFERMPYDIKLNFCSRPEQINGPSPQSWEVINKHLGTTASSLPEIVSELGKSQFGRVPRVGDSFCGGGSLPFEAARLGCDAYGSDLNPVAALLTWAALNITGGGEKVAAQVKEAQRKVFEEVDRQITAWGIEHREPDPKTGRRWRADAYLYCTEATCPECGWHVPLAPSWVIAEKNNVIVKLVPDKQHKRFNFEVVEGVTNSEKKAAADAGTAKNSELVCSNCLGRTPIRVIRGDGRGSFGDSRSLLRGWDNDDVVPRNGDVFGERLYCIRWADTWLNDDEKVQIERHYLPPSPADLKREKRVLELLGERLTDWQKRGFLPSRKIEPGQKTDEPIRTRGWTHWHHMFTPRQLLVNGAFSSAASKYTGVEGVVLTLLIGRLANWNSRLCQWLQGQGGGIGGGKATYANQALNTLCNYSTRPFTALLSTALDVPALAAAGKSRVEVCDGRAVPVDCDLWVTDPPYADAVCYDEISEHFLVWYEGHIARLFPKWYTDSRRALAVKGDDDSFTKSMVECYRRLALKMPDNGLQVVMFTHQDASVWAGLALILWAAGLRVTAAWCIATETGPAVGEGNYVQGTVLLVLRKHQSEETAFLDEVYNEVEVEVRRQLDSMKDLDDARDPNFTDTDYQLAAYAAALRVLTSKKIEEIDVAYELSRTRTKGEKSQVEAIIEKAVKIACDHLVPKGIDTHLWKSLTAMERFYLKGLEIESHGEHRDGVYQELARGFGVGDYRAVLASGKANQTRLRTATEFGRREMGDTGFGGSLVRHALFAASKAVETDGTRDSLTWLKTEVKDYAASRGRLIEILEFFASLENNGSMPHWHKDAHAAALVAGAMRNREDNV